MKRYIKASSDTVTNAITALQDSSNRLVDLILEIIDKLPDAEQYVKEYDAVVGEDESIESEFIDDINNVCLDVRYACRDVEHILDHYKPRKD